MLGDLRFSGEILWGHITDHTRSFRKPRTYSGAAAAVENTARFYRKAAWDDLPERVEVWTEKETLTGVLFPITAKYDIGLYPCRGYPSLSFLHDAAENIEDAGKPCSVYYFGDHDPSGADIARVIEKRLREFASDSEIYFYRLAVLTEQIESMNLTTRPTKSTDSRAGKFRGKSVEVEAILPQVLRELCSEAIESHIPAGHMDALKVAEASEKQIIRNAAAELRGFVE